MNNFKKVIVPVIVITIGSLLPLSGLAQVRVLDKIVAIVDDDVVLRSELEQRIDSVRIQISQSGTQAPPEDVLQQQVLDRLISERLQLTIGYDAGVRIADEELNQAIARIASSNKISVEQYIAQMMAQGSDIQAIREEIRNELIIMRVQQGSVMRRIRISAQELDNFLTSEEGRFVTSPDVNIGQILLSVPTGSNTMAIEAIVDRAESLYQQTKDGSDFRALAIANSADQSALQGGDL